MKKRKSLTKYLSLYFKSLLLFWQADKVNSSILIIIIPLKALIPSLLTFFAQEMLNQLSIGRLDYGNFLFWGTCFFVSLITIPLGTNVQGVLTDRLIAFVNTSLMNKTKELQGLANFEDADFYDQVQVINSQSSWQPVNLIVFGTSVISSSITIISMGVLLSAYNPLIALLILISMIPESLVSYRVQQEAFETMVDASSDARKMQYDSQAVLNKDFSKEIRLFNAFDFFIKRYQEIFWQIHHAVNKTRAKKMIVALISMSISSVICVFALLWFVLSIQAGRFRVGALLTLTSAIGYIAENIFSMIEDSSLLYNTLLYMEKYFNFLKSSDTIEKTGRIKAGDIKRIAFRHVSFAYPNSKRLALNDVDFEVSAGQKIAIVGENGSGKTTLIKLLLRFYDPSQGHLQLNGQAVQDFDLVSYRALFSAVFQDFAKFSLTVKDNIAMSDLNRRNDRAALVKAMSASGFAPNKGLSQNKLLNIQLGKEYADGTELSGGEWQKLALARGIFADRKILILDEPTASLDPRSEYALFQKFVSIASDKTVFFITHRLNSVTIADKVLVLNQGKVVAFDTHENLLKNNDYYRSYYSIQNKILKK
ncbi:ABC transporter ATP-binding protein (plasmid) [Oenococcus alcoholitolerans]|uniref:ABC transporter ATP-binding protein n=1 Tax=Oenococcus alcoholitolerans TaxID=931074 RepID=UPI003F6F085E